MSGRLCVILNSWQASNIYKSDSDTSFRVCLFQITSCFVFFLKIKKKRQKPPNLCLPETYSNLMRHLAVRAVFCWTSETPSAGLSAYKHLVNADAFMTGSKTEEKDSLPFLTFCFHTADLLMLCNVAGIYTSFCSILPAPSMIWALGRGMG